MRIRIRRVGRPHLLALALWVLVPTGAGAPEAVAQSGCYDFRGLAFDNGQQQQTLKHRLGTTVSGSLFVSSSGSCAAFPNHSVTMGEWVEVAPESWVAQRTSSVTLGSSGGAFSFPVGPGSSRELWFTMSFGSFAYTHPSPLTLTSVVRPSFEASPRHLRNGDQVFFTGALPQPFYRGLPTVALQVRQGKKWRPFKVVELQPDGTFNGVYRFTKTRSRSSYRFRAKALAGGTSYPYALKPSKDEKVVVKP